MAEIGKGVIPVTFDKAQIGRDLSSSVEHGAKSSEGSISSTFKKLAGIATAAFAGVQVVGFVKDSIDAARESNKIAAQTEAVIASTGGAAKLTASQFSDLANSISAKTGIDDEQIQSAENLLATFTNIRNEVGANNDIFSQTTKIAVDMGAALGGDASSNAIQLGKALNDPIRGLSALTRVGVTFTDEQRAQVKAMQESGDLMGAQKVILAELNKEFGGSAEATATAGAKWGVFWGNLQEKLGNLLIPMMDAVAEWAMTTLPNAFGVLQDTVGPVIEDVVYWVRLFADALVSGLQGGGFFADGDKLLAGVHEFGLVLRNDLWPIIQTIAGFIADNWQPILLGLVVGFGLLTAPITTLVAGLVALYVKFRPVRDFVGWVSDNIVPVLGGALTALAGILGAVLIPKMIAWAAATWAQVAAQAALILPWIAAGVALFALGAALVYAYQNFEGFRTVVDAVGSWLRDTLWPIMQTVFEGIITVVGSVISFVVDHWPQIQAVMQAVWDLANAAWENIGKPIFDTALVVAQAVIDFFTAAWPVVVDLFGHVFKLMQDTWDTVGAPIFGLIQTVVTTLIDWFKTAWDPVTTAFSAVWDAAKVAWDTIGAPIFNTIKSIIDGIAEAARIAKNAIDAVTSFGNIGPNTIDVGGINAENERKWREANPGQEPPRNALGTDFWKGGSTWVGEKGPEIVTLPRGSQIFSHDASMAMAGGGERHVHLNVVTRERLNVADEVHRLELING